jgi:tripartite-type tricarboxylate transporter receptor subunit TctC
MPTAWGQTAIPDKPIRVVVPFGAGSSPDVIARLWGERLAKAIGQPVVIDNRPGAASIIGTQAVLAAPADGSTVLYTVANTVSINPYIYKSLPYKAEDLQPVSQVLSVPLVMVVSSNSPHKTIQDLIAAAKAQPGKINYASYGVGTSMHVAMARFLTAAGVTMNHVPYKDQTGLNDVIAGTVDVLLEPSTTAMANVKAGKLRALGLSSPKTVAALPGIPPIADTLPGYVGDSWHGVFVRSGTPTAIVDKLNSLSQEIINSEDFRKRLTDLGLVPAGGSVAAFRTFLAEDARAWSKVVKDYDIKAD